MKVELTRTFSFSAAHALPAAPAGHQCRATHGHNFTVEVSVSGEVDPETGWLVDYGDLKAVVRPLIERLDHQNLNDLTGLANPTSENLSRWIWDELIRLLPGLSSVMVSETPSSRCTYRGDR